MKNFAEKYNSCKEKLKTAKPLGIHGKDYLTVASRHSIFMEYFNGSCSIDSNIIDNLCDKDRVAVKVIITIGDNRFTGLALERFDSSFINKTSALENAETSALGRALASFGLHGSEYASYEEVANAKLNQNKKPITKKAPTKKPVFKDPNEFVNAFKKIITTESKNAKNQKFFEDKIQPYLSKYEGDLSQLESHSKTLHEKLQQHYTDSKATINNRK